jgi:hypothetical protein
MAWKKAGGCKDQVSFVFPRSVLWVFTIAQIIACNDGGDNSVCSRAQQFCNQYILGPLEGIWDVYYVPTKYPDPYPAPFDKYLNNPAVASKIGSHGEWREVNRDVYDNFAKTGDWMRSSMPDLEKVINAGVRTVIYDGDADYILNFKGVEAMVYTSPHPFFSHFKFALTTVPVFTGRLSKDGLFVGVRAAEFRGLHRQWRVRRSVQERGHVLVRTHLRRGT